MKEELKNKIAALKFENLPDEIEGFAVKKIFDDDGDDKFIFFSCDDKRNHCGVTIYFHEETMEFKVREKIGLTEFCLTKFFTEDFAHFKEMIDSQLVDVLKNLRGVRKKNPNRFLREKKIDTWSYIENLPATLKGFELFITPAAPVEVTNGSFIIINYADFFVNSDFVLYYNVYTDDFSGERRVDGAPQVTYAFDAKTLEELEDKLEENLVDELLSIRNLVLNA